MEKKYTGFESYLEKHEITPEFVKDFTYWMGRYYHQWSLFTEWDDFTSICWTALLEGLPSFNPEVATIQTFCISRINNECWRIYMKNKTKRMELDVDDPIVGNELVARDMPDVSYFNDFARRCFALGVDVDIEELYFDYMNGWVTDPVKAFSWWMMKEKESGSDD